MTASRGRPRKLPATKNVAVRIDFDTLVEVDAHATALSKEHELRFGRSDALRSLIRLGLDVARGRRRRRGG